MTTALKKPAQIFSVYDYDTRLYRYYAAPLGNVPATGHFRPAHRKVAEGLAMPLPLGCMPIGEGQSAQGVIATTQVGEPLNLFFWGSVLVGGYLIWRWLSKPRTNPTPRRRRRLR